MNKVFDSLNLSPQERRVVFGAIVVVFVVLNFWLVMPHFSDWKTIQAQRIDAEATLAKHEAQVAQKPKLVEKIDKLDQMGPGIQLSTGDSSSQLEKTITALTRVNSIILRNRSARQMSRGTNDYFEERSMTLDFDADTQQLVGFLHSLGDSNTMVRVTDLTVRPNQQLSKLTVGMTVVASFQKDSPSTSTPKAK